MVAGVFKIIALLRKPIQEMANCVNDLCAGVARSVVAGRIPPASFLFFRMFITPV